MSGTSGVAGTEGWGPGCCSAPTVPGTPQRTTRPGVFSVQAEEAPRRTRTGVRADTEPKVRSLGRCLAG